MMQNKKLKKTGSQRQKKQHSMSGKWKSKGKSIMDKQFKNNNSYEFVVVKDNDKIKEAHAKKDGKVFLKAIHDKSTTIVKLRSTEKSLTLNVEELEVILQLPKDLKKHFKPSPPRLEHHSEELPKIADSQEK
uniref:Uncharacterized protein n=1 Tax=Candidatus Kentrum sp. SD TaxID=2126332 RepID=A0A451BRU7_9GAMM|nr:MAG: hypothetical protein BECKSD772D_GA0070982_12003 [Candidatus Kentron sp. SD]